jgi:hypothetical protein
MSVGNRGSVRIEDRGDGNEEHHRVPRFQCRVELRVGGVHVAECRQDSNQRPCERDAASGAAFREDCVKDFHGGLAVAETHRHRGRARAR